MSDSGRQIGSCPHGYLYTREGLACVACLQALLRDALAQIRPFTTSKEDYDQLRAIVARIERAAPG